MKSRIISSISFIMIMVSLFSVVSFADDTQKETSPKMTYIDSYKGNINQGVFSTTVSAKITGKSNVTSVKIKMELQKLSSGIYSTVETWEQLFTGKTGSMEQSKITNSLSTYRLKATFTAYSGSASETKILYAY